jgi:membrane-bound lytic murein transglycosylase D
VPAPAAKAPATAPAAPAEDLHRVAPGETVYALARQYEVRPADLLAWNNLPPNAGLSVGQLIRLRPAPVAAPAAPATPPAAAKPTAAPAAAKPTAAPRPAAPVLYVPAAPKAAAGAPPLPAGGQHTVVPGETLYSISRLYKVKVDELKAWNNKTIDAVKVGEVLRVAAP